VGAAVRPSQRQGHGGGIGPLDTQVGPNVRANSRDICPNGHGVIQSETAVAVSGSTVVVGYNDFRGFYCSNNGYQPSGWAFSLDGGQTFTDGGPLPGGTSWHGDPWLATGPDGTIYMAGLYSGGMAVTRGTPTDTGVDWSSPTQISVSSADKEAMAIDPQSGAIYITYTSFSAPTGIDLFRSTDGGVSFQGPVSVSGAASLQASVPAIGPNGELYITWSIGYPNESGLGFARSLDGGQTFTVTPKIATTQIFQVPGTDRAPANPHIAVDTSGGPNNGNVYVAWQSKHLTGKGDSLLIRSTDGGDSWDDPVIINDDGGVGIQWFPTISVDSQGNLDAFFYDRRDNPNTTLTNLYFAQSTDGGQTFDPNVLVTEVPSEFKTFSDGTPAWGDYINSTTDGGDAIVAYADGRDGDPDAYFVRLTFT
jgi:hypothetical protein